MGYSLDYRKLNGRITEKVGTKKIFANKMNLSITTIYSKLNGKIQFTQGEILNACKILDIENDNISVYFFNTVVAKNTTNN